MLGLEHENMTYQELAERVRELDKKLREHQQAEDILRRQNEYLTALHETSLGLIDHLGKEELAERKKTEAILIFQSDARGSSGGQPGQRG